MKYLMSFVFFVLLACNPIAEVEVTRPVFSQSTLKVLDIGNSYTDDATALLPLIAENSGIDMTNLCLYKATRGGATYKNWYDVYNDKDIGYAYSISKVLGGLNANVVTGEGPKGDGSLFRSLLTNEQWDVIIIHQMSSYAPYYNRWTENSNAGYLNELLNIIKKHQPKAVIGTYIIHSLWDKHARNKERSSFERWKLISQSVKQMQKDYGIDFVIPYGTAIENLRASSLNNEYDLTRDGTHCGYGLCRYTAACCYYEALIAPQYGISVLGNNARYDVSMSKNSRYPGVSVTDRNAVIAQYAAVLATKHMFECINPEQEMMKDVLNSQ